MIRGEKKFKTHKLGRARLIKTDVGAWVTLFYLGMMVQKSSMPDVMKCFMFFFPPLKVSNLICDGCTYTLSAGPLTAIFSLFL